VGVSPQLPGRCDPVSVTDVGLEVRVLGTVDFSWCGEPVALDRPLERALAVRLALARGVPVRDDALARDLWGDVEQARPTERLRVLASRLRASLGPASGALRRAGGGYALACRPVDVVQLEAAVDDLRTGGQAKDGGAVEAAAARALAVWRGPALADLRSVPFAAEEGERLEAVRVDVQLESLSAVLDRGDANTAVGELDRLAQDHPLHERLCCLLAVGLYRVGRQADALDRLARLRKALADELGVDPAPDTTATELRILRQDPDLLPAPTKGLPDPRLPLPPTTFVGRDSERAALLDQLVSPGLITLTGTPGSGKTRLALEVARAAQARHRPVAWVDLAPLREPDAVGPAITNATAVDAGGDDPVPRLADALSGALLVIDNAEHLVEPVAGLVSSLLRHAVRLSVLVTSQRALLISGEELHQVGPLGPAAAAGLFCERSGAIRDHRVDRICAAVDHLPLGVELAAGLTRTLTLDQLASRIDDRLRLLVGGSRDAGERHTSLRAALDWSYQLLDPIAQIVLRRLAVFAGGCTLEAAEAVVAGDDVPLGEVAPSLAGLADRSLITVSGSAPRRFRLLESVRDYATSRLDEAGETQQVRARHLAWCRAHVVTHDVQGEDEAAALEAIFAEWPNLLSALDDAPGTERAADALRLAVALDDAWMFRGLHDQARRHYGALVDAPGVTDGERARALSNYGFASTLVGATVAAAALLDRAEHLARDAGDSELQMRVLYHRGITAIEGGWPAAAFEPLRAGEQIAVDLGRPRSVSAFQDVVATALCYSGQARAAAEQHRAANQVDRAGGHEHGLLRGLVNEGNAWIAAGDMTAALTCASEAEEPSTRLGDLVALSTIRSIQGRVALASGELVRAVGLFRAALAQMGPEETQTDAQVFRLDLADALLQTGEVDEARQLLDVVLAATRDHGVAWLIAQPTVAALALADGDVERAVSACGQAEHEYERRSFQWQPALDRLAHVRALRASL
jgi:predicted ATPase/DNA-binding SARP family transcriptional activator